MNKTTDKTALPEWAKTLKRLRLKAGESQETFGARFQVTKMAVSYWESGRSEPPAAVLVWALRSAGLVN